MSQLLQDVVNALSLGGLYALAALGIALIFGVMRLINFAHGELIMIGAYGLLVYGGAPWPVVVGATLLVCVVVALGMERLAFRPVRGANEATLLVTSFAVSSLLQNVMILVTGSRPESVSAFSGLTASMHIGSVSVDRVDIVTLASSLVLLLAVSVVLNRSMIGIQIRAASENLRMARALGVRTNRVVAFAFAISGVLAGAAALLLVARTGSLSITIGSQPALIGFVATVIGGMGSLRGAVVGGYLLGAVTVLLQVALPDSVRPYRDAFVFAGVIVILIVRPQGLLPTRLSKERV